MGKAAKMSRFWPKLRMFGRSAYFGDGNNGERKFSCWTFIRVDVMTGLHSSVSVNWRASAEPLLQAVLVTTGTVSKGGNVAKIVETRTRNELKKVKSLSVGWNGLVVLC